MHNPLAAMNRYLPLVLVIGLLIAFRALGTVLPESLPNFQPLAAVFFCGALLASQWKGFAIPVGVWALTYPLGVGHTGSVSLFITTLAAFALVFGLGKWLSTRGFASLLLGSLASAVLFHLVTNGVAWAMDPRYAKTLAGLAQSLWLGAPGDVLPSWAFLRNMAAANLIFTAIFLAARMRLPQVKLSQKEGLAIGH